MLSARHGTIALLQPLLSSSPAAAVEVTDKDGNTALHHASAAGELLALRILLEAGASPFDANNFSWTPVAYSSTVEAEQYFTTLVAEYEKRRVETMREARERDRDRMKLTGLRIVADEEPIDPFMAGQLGGSQDSSDSATSEEWSPRGTKRSVTPTGA